MTNGWTCEPYTVDGLAWSEEELILVNERLQAVVPGDETLPWLLTKEQWTPLTIYYRAERNKYGTPVTFGHYTIERICDCIATYYARMEELSKKLRRQIEEALPEKGDNKQ